MDGWRGGELYVRHENNSPKDGWHKNNSPEGWAIESFMVGMKITRQRMAN